MGAEVQGTAMRAYVLCLFVVVFYAGNILTGRALNDLPPSTVALLRLVIALLVLLPVGWRSAWRARRVFVQHAKPLLLLTLTGVTSFNALIYAALHHASATNVSVLETLIPAVTVVLSAWLLRERLRPVQWAGVLLSLLGAVWVVVDGRLDRLADLGSNQGVVFMAGAIAAWAWYSVGVKRYLHLFPGYGAVLVMTGLSVLLLLPVAAVEWMAGGVPQLGGRHWWGLLYLGIFPSVVALLFYNRAVATIGPSRASVFLNLLPVMTMVGASLLLGEAITATQVLGAALVIGGVVLTTRTPAAGGRS